MTTCAFYLCGVTCFFFNLFIQDERLRSMDRFFDCVATLMSNNLRCLVESSLDDLASIFEVYKNGNEFHGEFERRLPVMPQPIIINVVSRITTFRFIIPFKIAVCTVESSTYFQEYW